MPVKIGDQEFDSKVRAKEAIREKLKSFDPADPIWPALLDRHPNKNEKIGAGVRNFFVSLNPINGESLQLNVLRVDGSIEHFSWLKCVDARPTSTRTNLLAAMRLAIMPQTQRFKDKSGKTCELCKAEVEPRLLRHVDHYPATFSALASRFLSENKNHPVEFDDCKKSNQAKFREKEQEFEYRWRAFHYYYASFRILCKDCNTRRL